RDGVRASCGQPLVVYGRGPDRRGWGAGGTAQQPTHAKAARFPSTRVIGHPAPQWQRVDTHTSGTEGFVCDALARDANYPHGDYSIRAFRADLDRDLPGGKALGHFYRSL